MALRAVLRGVVLILVVVTLGVTAQAPAPAVSESEVEEACAASDAQYQDYVQAREAFEEAAVAYEQILQEQEALRYRRDRLEGIVERRQEQIEATDDEIQQLARQLYMEEGAGTAGLMLFADSLDEIITGSEFLSAATEDTAGTLDDMLALRSDLERYQSELADLDAELREVEAERLAAVNQRQELAEEERSAWDRLSSECQDLRARYEAEQARLAAARRARQNSQSQGVGSIGGFVCPFPGSSFIDSWGYPRSGGRTHKGTDMMGPYGAPLVAASTGTVYVSSNSLGGLTLWLSADNGFGYYYAHLSDVAVSSGQRVAAGDVVGYNGDSGNARGGAPHLHFQIHPGGRGSPPVNPYSTLVGACR